MGIKKFVYSLAFTLILLGLAGCGSSMDPPAEAVDEPRFGVDEAGIRFMGSEHCLSCHEEMNPDLVGRFLGSNHVQPGRIDGSASDFCLSCHDPIRDGRTLEPFLPGEIIPMHGLAAVGCEDCHGAGGQHFGFGPLPHPQPDFNQCGNCHRSLPAGPAGHAGAFVDNILENYQAGKHADSVRGTSALCFRCHTDEGYRQHVGQTQTMNTGQLVEALAGELPPGIQSPVQCRTCHDGHSGELRLEATLDQETGATIFSREFNLCTSCHQVFLTASFDAESGTFNYQLDPEIYDSTIGPSNPALNFHHPRSGSPVAREDNIITDTHFAAVDDGSGNPVVGYNIEAGDERACTICHDPHGASKFAQAEAPTIATQWGGSGHGDYQDAPFTADLTQPVCFRCHSGTEFADYLEGVDVAALDPSEGARVIGCVACHDLQARDAGDALALGPLRRVEEVTFPSGVVVSLEPASNICMECHQGRSSTPTVDSRIAAGNLSFSNIHYYAAAATLFGTEVQGGYEYPGRSYRGRNAFAIHAGLGVPRLTNCNGCHLRGENDHTFLPLLSDCALCHPVEGFRSMAGSPAFNHEQIELLKDQLLTLLIASGVEPLDHFPYFQNITTENQLKAAYNWQVADKDPGGYIHNGIYIRQLLHDSIIDMGETPLGAPVR
jgi:hypothetical protein